jgi:hypothetical protein
MIGRILKGVTAAAMLVAPGTAPAQTRPQGCVIEQWPAYLVPDPQSHRMRERIATDAGEIWAIEFGPLEGEYAKLFLFFLVRDGCERKVLSVGSYGYLNDFARERGEIGEGERVYHLDLFDPESQTTLEIRHSPPSYTEMREKALGLLR